MDGIFFIGLIKPLFHNNKKKEQIHFLFIWFVSKEESKIQE